MSSSRSLFLSLPLVTLFVTICVHAFPQEGEAREEKKPYQGLLWKITGNGLDNPSYLYGTMHVSNKIAFYLSKDFFNAIEDCDAVALESSPSIWMDEIMGAEEFPEYEDLVSDQYAYRLNMAQTFYEKAFHLTPTNNERLSRFISNDNQLTDRLLFRARDASGNFEESTYLDLFIFRAGKKMGKKIVSLEDFNVSMEMSFRGMETDDDGESGIKSFIEYEDEQKRVTDLMEETYRRGDLFLLDSIVNMAASQNYLEYFLYKRNRVMADNIDSLLQNDTRTFSGIGAAHLPGEKGVIKMLRDKGYELQPMERNFSKKSRKAKRTKKKIEENYHPVEFQRTTAPDSAFSISVPGELYETMNVRDHKEYLHPDMTNGIFYQVRRVNTYSPLTGRGVEYHKKQIDSLLFENIPGEIKERESITFNGHPGFDVLNETTRGNIQRYRIIIKPLEIHIYKAGGTGDLVEGKPGKRFFGSLEIQKNSSEEWHSYEPPQGTFQVDIPGKPLLFAPRTTDVYKEGHFKLEAMDPSTEDYFLLMKTTLHDYDYIEEDSFELERLARKFAEPFDLEVDTIRFTDHKGYPALRGEYSSDKTDRGISFRILIRGGEYYLLVAAMKSDEDPGRFLDSFSFAENRYQLPFEVYTDTSLHFTTHTIAPDTVPEYSLAEVRRKVYNIHNSSTSTDRWFNTESKAYCTYVPAERLKVSLVDMKDFTWVSDTTQLWNSSSTEIYPEDMILKRAWVPEDKDSSEMWFVHTDTNSVRCILSRNLYYKGAVFSIMFYTDTLSQTSKYVGHFMEDFQPRQDTSFGRTIFEDKTRRFFEVMRNGDSAEVEKAMDQFYLVEFKEDEVDSLMAFVKNYSFKDRTKAFRKEVIERLGWFDDHDGIIPFMKEVYTSEYANTGVKFAVLKGLAMRWDKESNKALVELMDQSVPLSSDESYIEEIFDQLKDTLELSTPVVPDIFKHTDYQDYKYHIYNLVGTLVDSGLVDGEEYASYKGRILRDGKRLLQKQLASEEEQEEEESENISFTLGGKEYSYTPTGGTDLSKEGRRLLDVASLLAPFYPKDEKVQGFFEKMKGTEDSPLLFASSILFLHHDIPVSDTLWKHFAMQDRFRNDLYQKLCDIDKCSRFDTAFKDQKLIARGALYEERDPTSDSVEFLCKRKVNISGKKGYVYFFKSKRSYQDDWYLDYSGLQPLDPNMVDVTPSFSETGEVRLDGTESIEEVIDEQVDEISVRDRERVAKRGLFW